MTDGSQQNLDQISEEYRTRTPDREVDSFLISIIAERVAAGLHGRSIIELGLGDRVWTPRLLERFDRVISVDGSSALVDAVRSEITDMRWTGFASYFEDFVAPEQVDVVLATYVLEHVDDPELVLRRCATWLRPGGELVVVVPNAGSLHRRLAKAMGLVKDPTALGDADRRLGHKRVFTAGALVDAVRSAGFRIVEQRGYLAKSLPNSLLTNCTEEQLRGLVDLGDELPIELTAALLVRAVLDPVESLDPAGGVEAVAPHGSTAH